MEGWRERRSPNPTSAGGRAKKSASLPHGKRKKQCGQRENNGVGQGRNPCQSIDERGKMRDPL